MICLTNCPQKYLLALLLVISCQKFKTFVFYQHIRFAFLYCHFYMCLVIVNIESYVNQQSLLRSRKFSAVILCGRPNVPCPVGTVYRLMSRVKGNV